MLVQERGKRTRAGTPRGPLRALVLPLCGKDRAQSAERKRSAPRALRNDARDKFSRPARKCATRKTDEPIKKCAALRAAHLKAAIRLEFAVSIAGSMQGARNARFSPELTVCWERRRRKSWQGVRRVS
ncbi:hypothetical protein DWV16_04655 [Anaerotruncus sp. AF02-27]|nr:hypothetical protein DWV16_04655 [Anaerotruncus sp. AF02-27]